MSPPSDLNKHNSNSFGTILSNLKILNLLFQMYAYFNKVNRALQSEVSIYAIILRKSFSFQCIYIGFRE